MKRVIEAEMETTCNKFTTALNRFLKKYPELEYWKETFEYMSENGENFFCDNYFASGEYNKDWAYALHLNINGDCYYMCVIERA